jgi:hypothetical protein
MKDEKFKRGDTVVSDNKSYVVLVTDFTFSHADIFAGVILKTDNPERKPVGYFATNWATDSFYKVNSNLSELKIAPGNGFYFARINPSAEKIIIKREGNIILMHGSENEYSEKDFWRIDDTPISK